MEHGKTQISSPPHVRAPPCHRCHYPCCFWLLVKFVGAVASIVLFVISPNFGSRNIDGFWVIFWKLITWFCMNFVDLVWTLLFFGIFMGFDWIQVLGSNPKNPSLAKSWPLGSSILCLNWMGKMGGESGTVCWMTLDVGLGLILCLLDLGREDFSIDSTVAE